MSDWIPDEVLTDHILARLPVRSLLRCRSVCKQWRSVIDSPEFIKFRLDQDSATTDDVFLLTENLDSYIYSIPSHQTISQGILPQCHYPSPFQRDDVVICGSSHGLVCLAETDINETNTATICILNPATRKHHVTLAPAPEELITRRYSMPGFLDGYGFGYDSVSKDYKFVRLCYMYDNKFRMYNSWLKLVSFGIRSRTSQVAELPTYYSTIKQELGVLVGGALHWPFDSHVRKYSTIVAYDLGTNQCRTIPLPREEGLKNASLITLVVLRNCLCLCELNKGFRHVWMMKEYGVTTSWSKLFSVRGLWRLSSLVVPLWLSMDGEKAVLRLGGRRLLWYDIKKERPGLVMYLDAGRFVSGGNIYRKHSRSLKRKRGAIGFEAIACLGSSLVRPADGTQSSGREERQDDDTDRG